MSPTTAQVVDVRFEHHRPQYTLGLDNPRPRISWTLNSKGVTFNNDAYEIEITEHPPSPMTPTQLATARIDQHVSCIRKESCSTQLVPWPREAPLGSRQKVSIRVRAFSGSDVTAWSETVSYETGLLSRDEWTCQRITSAQLVQGSSSSQSEQLLRKSFNTRQVAVSRARLYVMVQGVYEAELNGRRVSDNFLAPGWTAYDHRIRYQTYEVTHMLSSDTNCLGFRLADGWFCGRLGFFGGRRQRYGSFPALMTQLEITYEDGVTETVLSDSEWHSRPGPAYKAELYDGEKYDANLAVPNWSASHSSQNPKVSARTDIEWDLVAVLEPLDTSMEITSGLTEPVRRIETIRPVELITTPSGKKVVDFGQNLVGYVRLTGIHGTKGHRIDLHHAEVLESGEIGLRPLRFCEAADAYICDGADSGQTWEPSFTFHGFRYCQIDGWNDHSTLLGSVEAVVCHTDVKSSGDFNCSDENLNKLYRNATWSTKGNFFSIPTDCPQRDERLGWTGDIAQFAPTATKLFNFYGFLKDWMVDVRYDQTCRGGVPAYVTPNIFDEAVGIWSLPLPVAVWHDVIILVPWALYMSSGDTEILKDNYQAMKNWITSVPRDDVNQRKLWARDSFQLGDWLDPTAPPEQPMNGATDPLLVADAFLTRSLYLLARIATALGHKSDCVRYAQEADHCRQQFLAEYVSPNGRISSDSQTAYALAICFDLLPKDQNRVAGHRLATIMKRNRFKIGTGFAGTPFLCEALARTGHADVAYAVLLCQECPSWLYTVLSGGTTLWERWDSMLPDGKVNPGEMTSFNHYCFGSVVTFMCERLGGLQCLHPGWSRMRFAPQPGGGITSAQTKHETPYGWASIKWQVEEDQFTMWVVVPALTEAEVIVPNGKNEIKVVGTGEWKFSSSFEESTWPLQAIEAFPDLGITKLD